MDAGTISRTRSRLSRCTSRSRHGGTEDGVERNFYEVAPKWCKADQNTENRVVSLRSSALFHILINTCVENLTDLKYLQRDSARLVLARRLRKFFTGPRQRW